MQIFYNEENFFNDEREVWKTKFYSSFFLH